MSKYYSNEEDEGFATSKQKIKKKFRKDAMIIIGNWSASHGVWYEKNAQERRF